MLPALWQATAESNFREHRFKKMPEEQRSFKHCYETIVGRQLLDANRIAASCNGGICEKNNLLRQATRIPWMMTWTPGRRTFIIRRTPIFILTCAPHHEAEPCGVSLDSLGRYSSRRTTGVVAMSVRHGLASGDISSQDPPKNVPVSWVDCTRYRRV